MKQRLAFVLGVGLLMGGVTPAAGQTYRWDIGPYAGGSWWSSLVGADETGSGSVSFEPSWLIGAQTTLWLVPRVGVRLQFPYEDRAMKASDGTLITGDEPRSLDHINIMQPSLDLLFRLKQPASSFVAGEWLPYLAAGVGIRYVNPAGDRYITYDVPNSKFWTGVPFGIQGTGNDTLFLGELSGPMGLLALGTDWRMAQHMALRFEIGDRMSTPYVYAVTPDAGGRTFHAIDGEDNLAKLAHDIYGTIGLNFTVGGAGPEAVVVAAPPPPPPPPPPAQTPPPAPRQAPREESMSVCVIDPATAGGMRTVSVTYMPETRDTLVLVNGQRVAFSTTVPNVTVASGADWLVAGRPLELGKPVARFLAVGQTTTPAAGSLILLGTVNGLPVYGEASAFSGVSAQVGTGELNTVLGNAAVKKAFDEAQTLYVPYRTVGCAFQPLQRQEEVRKGK